LHLARAGARQEEWLDSAGTSTLYIPPVAGTPTLCASQCSNSCNFSSSRRTEPLQSRFERLIPGCLVLTYSALAAQTRLLVPVRLPHIHEMMTCNIGPNENHPAQSCSRHHFLHIQTSHDWSTRQTETTYRSGIRLALISSGPSGTKIRFAYI
jgi:hypothetical protein